VVEISDESSSLILSSSDSSALICGLPVGSCDISTFFVVSAALTCKVPPSLVDSVKLTGRLPSDA